jgi:SAM-dependent methyltransferase
MITNPSTTLSLEQRALPPWAPELAAFHRAFENELASLVQALPVSATMRVLDVGCGDGFYCGLLASRLAESATLVGFDKNRAMLAAARARPEFVRAPCQIEFQAGDISELAERFGEIDFVWCAQSLFSLPDPVEALRQMGRTLKPGGLIAVLENDSLHQLFLPWPTDVEIALRSAEYAALLAESRRPAKYYVGRRLPSVVAEAGLEPLGFRTQAIDRQAPLDRHLELFLWLHLNRLFERIESWLDADTSDRLRRLIDPDGPDYLPRQPHFAMTWTNVLVWGRKPL